MHTSTFRVRLPVSAAEAFAWHERPGALQRLTPPWEEVEVVRQEGGIRDGGEVTLKVKRGPVSFRWELRHTDYVAGKQFVDEQVSGPFAHYRHVHRFLPGEEAGTCVLEDELTWDLPGGSAGEMLGGGMVEGDLERLFQFRHRRLLDDLALQERFSQVPPRRVAVTGSTGLMGTALSALLATGGHTVIPVTRNEARARKEGGIYWDPMGDEIDAQALEGVDAVVHLAGEPINAVRWTDEKKRLIRESRVKGTALLARTLAQARNGPGALVMASAVGFYGDRKDEWVDEESRRGDGFLADVVEEWEGAARRAEGAGIRVAKTRFGLVLSTQGGALPKMLWAFKSGLAGRIGSGRQYVSWVDLDDATGLLYAAVMDPKMKGVYNATSPNPVTNAAFTDILGRVVNRPFRRDDFPTRACVGKDR